MNLKSSLKKSFHSAITVLKLVIPIYILADILFYYNTLSYISFLIEPFTSLLNLPKEAALAIISGIFLNLYAAIAFAAPLNLDAQQWTILAIFLGVCHSLPVESAILKKIGISINYSNILRFVGGLFIAYTATLLPSSLFENSNNVANIEAHHYNSILQLIENSLINSVILSLKIIALITVLIFIMDFIKSLPFLKEKNVSKSFSLTVGLLLGITYGAGILISEAKNISKIDIFFVATFLNIAHAMIEDPLLFVIFGANLWVIIAVRIFWAIVFAFGLTWIFAKLNICQVK